MGTPDRRERRVVGTQDRLARSPQARAAAAAAEHTHQLAQAVVETAERTQQVAQAEAEAEGPCLL